MPHILVLKTDILRRTPSSVSRGWPILRTKSGHLDLCCTHCNHFFLVPQLFNKPINMFIVSYIVLHCTASGVSFHFVSYTAYLIIAQTTAEECVKRVQRPVFPPAVPALCDFLWRKRNCVHIREAVFKTFTSLCRKKATVWLKKPK